MNAERHHDLERIGMRVAAEQDRRLHVQALPDADLLLAGIGARQRRHQQGQRRRALRAWAGAATLCVMVLSMLGVLQMRGRGQLVAGSGAAGSVSGGTATAQPALGITRATEAPVPLRFADGTRVVVKPEAAAELRAVSTHGATIALERGTIDVDVVHTDQSRWDVIAGQFDIRVTGTRFDATWDPQKKQLTVAMVQGTVRVSGPCVDEPLSAPVTKVFTCSDTTPTVTTSDLPTVTTSLAPSPSRSPSLTRSRSPAPSPSPSPAPADERPATARELLASADAARLSGDATGARKGYLRLREQFPRTDEAAKAAFLLGRMAEANGASDDAVRAYASVMSESPNGAFAQDALGRTMQLEQRRGNTARARALANEYVGKHPNGPYRAYAASVLDAHAMVQ